ncbi:hypothetical protein chiPu_0031314, partial [Chiloscyllium punctatum]|nr:hypothetical protein [Chiloscyllium punctatum]
MRVRLSLAGLQPIGRLVRWQRRDVAFWKRPRLEAAHVRCGATRLPVSKGIG